MDLSSPLSIVIRDTKNAAVNVLAQVYPGQFLNFGTPNVLSRQFFVVHVCVWGGEQGRVRGSATHCRVLSNIPGLYPLDASSTSSSLVMTIKNIQP